MNRRHIGMRPPGVQAYSKDRCRCYGCCSAKQAYRAHRERRIASDTWQPFTDAAPVREHLLRLAAAGIGMRRVSELTGVSRTNLLTIIHARSGRPMNTRVRVEHARAILHVQPGIDTARDGALIDATGTHRRIHALIATGFPRAYLSGRLRIHAGSLFETMRQQQVTAKRAKAIRALYDELSMKRPADLGIAVRGITRALNEGRNRGWPRPLQWDDEEIDDPTAQPHYGDVPRPRGYRRLELLEDAMHIVGHTAIDLTDPRDREFVAGRLEITPGYLEKLLAKAA